MRMKDLTASKTHFFSSMTKRTASAADLPDDAREYKMSRVSPLVWPGVDTVENPLGEALGTAVALSTIAGIFLLSARIIQKRTGPTVPLLAAFADEGYHGVAVRIVDKPDLQKYEIVPTLLFSVDRLLETLDRYKSHLRWSLQLNQYGAWRASGRYQAAAIVLMLERSDVLAFDEHPAPAVALE